MLSYSSALVLGIIAERPINPYEMKKLLGKLSIRKWLPIAASSLYATIRSLAQAGLIGCETERSGNMPEKKVYHVNGKGSMALDETLRSFLGSVELDKKKTHIAALMICHLPKAEALEILQKKIRKLENMELMVGRILASLEGSRAIPYNGLFTVRHELALIKAELACTWELAAAADADDAWEHFVSRIM
jgi:DNA-binding PadR family transcriptional regulator